MRGSWSFERPWKRYRPAHAGPAALAVGRVGFERHLERCPPCVNYLDSYRATIALARDACASEDVPRPPDSLVRAILDARRGRG